MTFISVNSLTCDKYPFSIALFFTRPIHDIDLPNAIARKLTDIGFGMEKHHNRFVIPKETIVKENGSPIKKYRTWKIIKHLGKL